MPVVALPTGRLRSIALPHPSAVFLLSCAAFLATLALRSPALLLRPRL